MYKLTKPVFTNFHTSLCLSLQVYVCSAEEPCSREYQHHRYPRHPVGGETEDKPRSATLLRMLSLCISFCLSLFRSALSCTISSFVVTLIYDDFLSLVSPFPRHALLYRLTFHISNSVSRTFSLHSSSPHAEQLLCSTAARSPL